MKIKRQFLIFPVASALICFLLAFTSFDNKLADLFQRALPSTEQSKSVIMVNIDDVSVEQIGTWPFGRDVYADCLKVMKDLGAGQVVFDLSFLDKSPAKVDETYVDSVLPGYIEDYFARIQNEAESGELTSESLEEIKNGLLSNTSYVTRSFDKIFEEGIRQFGNTFLAITFDSAVKMTEEQAEAFVERCSIPEIRGEKDSRTPVFQGALQTLPEFLDASLKAGFVNADTDSDSYLRRLHLVLRYADGKGEKKYRDKYYGQLVFVPILQRFGNPEVIVTNSSITLKNAKIDENTVKDIVIPRGEDGSVIVKYPKCVYDDYNNISLWNIYRISRLEDLVYQNIREMQEAGYFDYADEEFYSNFEAVNYIQEELKNGEDEENGITYASYLENKNALLKAYEEFFSDAILEKILADVGDDEEWRNDVNESYTIYRANLMDYLESCESVKSQIQGAMCIFGTTATSTSDFGVNQYQKTYPNPGVHYTMANQLLSQDFVDDCSIWVSLIIALVICVIYSVIASMLKGTRLQIASGISFIVFTILFIFLFFIFTRTYLGVLVPVAAVTVVFIATTLLGYLTASKDKKFITNAFSQCLSKEVVNEIVANPSSFKLGGQKLEMTAIFTDIQKFSSFSELLTAGQLVALLNYYLTRMSDIIMGERGTVDKYEGDAIIALFGAPVKMEDHAERAVRAAIKMKAEEVRMNQEIARIASGEKPDGMDEELYQAMKIMVENKKTLFTRIGLNSGEMIAGYMGSENKKNYTMMGNNVNLASRLEGVNKQYSTGGILCSEATRNLLGEKFVVRSLDRVRVVNVNTPIRLYEPLCEAVEGKTGIKEYVVYWEKAISLFEAKKYDDALKLFSALSEKKPDDNVCRYYKSLLEKFFTKGKYPVEADGIGVEYNIEDGVFKLLQK